MSTLILSSDALPVRGQARPLRRLIARRHGMSRLSSDSRRGRRSVAVNGGKERVGKGVIASNLVFALSQHGARVALLDANAFSRRAGLLCGLNTDPRLEDLLGEARSRQEIAASDSTSPKVIPVISETRPGNCGNRSYRFPDLPIRV